jgi:antitoxin (DNA-binding transcriptional repressor) of toxin-antitoxin stability system
VHEGQASEAKTHLPSRVDAVERGETIVITRHDRAMVGIVPEDGERRRKAREAIEDIKALRKPTGKMTVGELSAAKHVRHR